MKVLLQMMMILYISQYMMLISNVEGINLSKDNLSCKPGEGIGIFASGLASQCSGDIQNIKYREYVLRLLLITSTIWIYIYIDR